MSDATGDAVSNPEDTTVVVSRLVSRPIKDFWKILVTREGAEALLGKGGELGDKGDSWHAADGTFGVVRSYHPLEQIRFTWHAADEAPKTVVDVHLSADGDSTTRVEIRHERIPFYFDANALGRRWEHALDKLAQAGE